MSASRSIARHTEFMHTAHAQHHPIDWREAATVIVTVLVSFFSVLHAIPLFDLDEGAFSEATREMLASGNYLLTTLDGEPRYDKPILIYWLQALSVSALGLNEFALRLPSALAASAWCYAIYAFGRDVRDARTGLVAAMIMATTIVVVVIAKAATADALLNLWLALAMLDAYRYCLQPRNALRYRIYLWMGLGFLTKGPVAVVLPVFVASVYLFGHRRWRDWRRAAFFVPGWLLFLAVALPWYVAVWMKFGSGFLQGFFLEHNLGRFSSTMHGAGGNLFYYVGVLPVILLPYTGWFLSMLGGIKSSLRQPLDQYCYLWFATVFVLFSLSETQFAHYVLYGLTPLFVLMAIHRERLKRRWLAFLPPLLFLLLLGALPMIVVEAAKYANNAYEHGLYAWARHAFDARYGLLVALAIVATLGAWIGLRPIWRGLLAVGLAQTLVVNFALLPVVARINQEPLGHAAAIARAANADVVAYGIHMPSFSVYREAITPDRLPEPGEWVLTRAHRLDKLRESVPAQAFEEIYRRGGIVLLRPARQD